MCINTLVVCCCTCIESRFIDVLMLWLPSTLLDVTAAEEQFLREEQTIGSRAVVCDWKVKQI